MERYEELEAQAKIIKEETSSKANTALRVGLLFEGIIKFLKEEISSLKNIIQKILDKDIDISEKEYQKLVETGTVDKTKNYFIYEEE